MKRMKDVFAEQQRIIILQLMYQDSDYSLNDQILQKALDLFGHAISIDRIDAHLRFLEDCDLVEVDDLGHGMLVAKLSRKGMDVAQGRSRVDGIDRPIPME